MAGNNKGIYKRGRYYWICYAGVDGKVHRESARTTKSREAEAILTSRRNAVLEGKEPAIKKISNPYFYEVVEKYREITDRGLSSWRWLNCPWFRPAD